MTRGSFIKSVIALIAAPGLLKEIAPEPVEVTRKSYMYAITEEHRADEGYMNYILRDLNSDFWAGAKKVGINPDEDFTMDIGYLADDYLHNAIRIRLTQ